MCSLARRLFQFIFPLVGALLLSNCSDDGGQINQTHQSQSLQKQSTGSQAIHEEKSQLSGHEPIKNEYNANPSQGRFPYPPIPDEPANPAKEAQ